MSVIKEVQPRSVLYRVVAGGGFDATKFNTMLTDILRDVQELQAFHNEKMVPLLRGLPLGIDDDEFYTATSIDPVVLGLSGDQMWTDGTAALAALTDKTIGPNYIFWDSGRRTTIKEAFIKLNSKVSSNYTELQTLISSSGSGGSSLSVNGGEVDSANINDTGPAAISGVNVIWQVDGEDVSAYVQAGTTGDPGVLQLAEDEEEDADKAVNSADPRLSDDRDPNAHGLVSSDHTVSGLTAGHILTALTATTFGFQAAGATYTDEQAQDAVGSMIDGSLTYTDGTPLLQRSALSGDISASAGSNSTTLATVNSNVGSFGAVNKVGTFTVNAKGLVTAAADATIAITSGAVSDFTEAAQDATGAMVDASLTYVDGTPLLQRAALTGAITASAGSNTTSLGSFTKSQLSTAVSDGDPLYVGDVTQYTDEMAQDAIGAMLDSSLTYVDGTPLLQRAALTGDITASAGSNATTLATVNSNVGSFGSATQVATFTANAKGQVTAAGSTTIAVTSSAVSDFTEAAQDAVGIMVDTTLVYTDSTPSLVRAALTGDVTASAGSNVTSIAPDVVTYAKIQNIATDSLIGRDTAGAGDPETIGLNATLSMDGANNLQRAALIGDVTASAGSNTTAIATSVVTLAKMADMAAASVIYRKTAGTGAPEVNTVATLKTDLGLTGTNSGDQTITLTGDVTGSGIGSFTATIAADAVIYAKMQNVSATDKLLGRSTAGSGDVEEIACTAAARSILDDTTVGNIRTTLGVGTGDTPSFAGATLTGLLQPQGGIKEGRVLVTNAGSPYTVLATDTLIHLDCTAGPITITLPTLASSAQLGRQITFIKLDATANVATLTPAGGQTILGLATYPVGGQYTAPVLSGGDSAGTASNTWFLK